jgi:hypothetical protein
VTTRRLAAAFIVAAAVYLVSAVATIGTSSHPLRPLYEGIGPAPPYRWVRPPPAFKATNIAPIAVSQTSTLTSTGSIQTQISTTDAQLALSLPAGAIPPSPSHSALRLGITPVDPAKLGQLPPGLYPDGNAYRVSASYQPNQQPIAEAVKPIDGILRTPVPSVALFTSVDGQTWSRLVDHHIPGQAAVATTFTKFGYLLAASNVPVVTRSSSRATTIWLVVGLGVVAVLLVAVLLLRRSGRLRWPRS